MIDASGNASERMFNLGPGRLGTLLESIAVPEIRQQAVQLAELLSERVREANFLDELATSDVIRRQVGPRMEAFPGMTTALLHRPQASVSRGVTALVAGLWAMILGAVSGTAV